MQSVFRGPKETSIDFVKHPSTSFPPRPVYETTHMRNSLSPRKVRAQKKFYHFFNQNSQSIRRLEEEASPLAQFEGFIKQSEAVQQSDKKRLNDLLFPSTQAICQAQMVSFPCIEVKKIGQGPIRSQLNKRKSLAERRGETLEEIRKGSQSIALLDTHSNAQSRSNLRRISHMSKPSQSKGIIVPCIRPPKQNRTADDSASPSPTFSPQKTLHNAPSILKLESVQTEKTFKKGYLLYEKEGEKAWKGIKEAIKQEPCLVKLENRGVTARRFYVFDLKNMRPVVYKEATEGIEIASLTKIMTCYLAIVACQKYQTQLKQWTYRVPDRVAGHPGTSAQLEAGDLLSGEELLYGLMLPSGNDASICLAELVGKIIQKHRKKEQNKTYFETFMTHMNIFSKQLGLQQQWRNSSGLAYNPNFSTGEAIVALSILAMKNPLFRKVVSTREYNVDIKNDRYGLVRRKTWRNTNKLLEQSGWEGVKTGTTDTAGHCLMAQKGRFLIAVFDCQTLGRRFTDTTKLYEILSQKIQ